MSIVDVDALLLEIAPAEPCGPNLEYDPAFLELEQAVLGKPEVEYGSTITPAVPPEWKQVKRLAAELLERSRDLRIAIALLRANLALHGIEGLADSLGLIERLLAERWASVHPELDADDGMDPTLRVNSLAQLADQQTVLKDLKEAVFLVLPSLGPLSLRTLYIVSGELAPAEGQERLAAASIEAALGDVDEARVRAAADAFGRAHESIINIEAILMREVGSAQALNLDGLSRALKRGRDFLNDYLNVHRGGAAEASSSPADMQQEEITAASAAAGQGAAKPAAISGEISSREDVLRVIDKILKYYRQHEPSSPVPLLLERSRRLVPMSFLELMQDLAPDSVAQLLALRGSQEENTNNQ